MNSEIERVCHWGFDAANWKHYIRLPDNLVDDMRSQEMLLNFLHGENIRKRAHSLVSVKDLSFKKSSFWLKIEKNQIPGFLKPGICPRFSPGPSQLVFPTAPKSCL